MNKHNKKRNVGIVYEQLVTTVSRATVEGDSARANTALKIIKRYFAPGTELYREFRLVTALTNTQVKSDALASRILEETKVAARDYNVEKLRSEKSRLIAEINRTFDRDTFYQTPVKDYRLLATIGSLIEEWRSPSADVDRRLQFESRLHEHLLLERSDSPEPSELRSPQVNDLTVRIMRETFNKKFGSSLNESQRRLLQAIALGGNGGDLVKEMKAQRGTALKALELYRSQCDNRIVEQKIPRVLEALTVLDPEDTSDKNVARFMTVSQLCDELMENKND
jgi:hypothetical protein